jgi:hypothetical protein
MEQDMTSGEVSALLHSEWTMQIAVARRRESRDGCPAKEGETAEREVNKAQDERSYKPFHFEQCCERGGRAQET